MANGMYAAESSQQLLNSQGKGVYSDRQRDYYEAKSGEIAADNAFKRQEDFFNAYQSPKAQMKQLKQAGLSPSIYASGGLPGGSGTSGISGSGGGGNTGGTQATLGIMSAVKDVALMSAKISKTKAEKDLIKAQTNNLNENTITTEIENGIKKLEASTFENKWKILNNQIGIFFWNSKTGNMTSLSDIANTSKDYNEFEQQVLKNYDGESNVFLSSEEGRKTLREIYQANKKFGNDIAVLTNSEENAKLMLQITNLLNSNDFASESANAQIKQLRQISESTELTTEQKGAMNRLIDKMGHSTTADILLVLLMMLGQYSHTNFNFGVSQTNQIKK